MVTTSEVINSNLQEKPLAEKRVTLHNISWDAYEQILDALGDNRAARLTYYQGMLEIMTPLEEHESANSLVGQLIELLAEELNFNLKSMGSTTLKIPILQSSPEPDKCYYIQNELLVRGKIVDLSVDPPPDLILEVDITHTDINKKQMYQDMKVPEFWRYNGTKLTIYLLEKGEYQESDISATFSLLTKSMVYEFLAQCKTQGETQTKRAFRKKIQTLLQQ